MIIISLSISYSMNNYSRLFNLSGFYFASKGLNVNLFRVPHNYQDEGTSEGERTKVNVKAGTEVIFSLCHP